MNTLSEVLEGAYDSLARVTTQALIVIHDGEVTRKSRVHYANWGEATGRRGLCFSFFSQYSILFANITGSKIKKHVRVSTRGVHDILQYSLD